jgi:D-amino-acid dehydrogenase
MNATGRVIVVGGGVIGAACAYFLRRAGAAVTIVDQGRFGRGCSHGNCGLVCPSHVLPLASPGAAGTALRALLRPNGPLYIKPRIDPALWSWLWRFARCCNARDMLRSARAIDALLAASRRLYDDLLRDEPLECEWEARGLLFVFRTRRAMEHYAQTDRLLRDEFDLGAQRLDGQQLIQREPALKPSVAGGWYYDTDAHLRPDRLMASWLGVLQTQGIDVREHCPVRDFVRTGHRAAAVVTPQGQLHADAFVVAAGAWTPLLARQLGCRVPIQPGKGYSLTMPRPAQCPSVPLILEEDRVAVTPMRSGYRLGSTMEFSGYDARLNRRRLELLRRGAARYLQEPYCEPVQEAWFGWRPMTYHGRPIIDRSPAMSNVLIAAGHGMLGLSMAPATGKLVAELLCGSAPHVDPAPYRLHACPP